MGQKIFEPGDLQSSETFWNVLKLSPRDKLDKFAEMWFHVFLWAFSSYLFVHLVASLVAFISLRKHKIARFAPILLIISGVVTPLTMSLITSSAIAGVFRAASIGMSPLNAFLFGTGQTLVNLTFSFTRILATL
ncbi:transmembrane protein 170A-like [Panonychus citri]|uniref:transmembrane protein 170A-like n=1 Tax=Panonychus citri TaxID=50023 RepID=UPI002306FDAE|nr:transmembrane protein 170A-like [Panonychus citri]